MCQFKKIKWLLAYALLACCCLLFNACATITPCSKRNQEQLTQKVIFAYLCKQTGSDDTFIGEGLPKIDPLVCSREMIIINGKKYLDKPMHSDLLKYPHYKRSFKLVIPDSLKNRLRYTNSNTDYPHDYAIIHQFSPLLPTKEPGIFLMEHYFWASICDDDKSIDFCARFLINSYMKIKIDHNKITFLDDLELYLDTSDFNYGLMKFSRKKLESTPPEKE